MSTTYSAGGRSDAMVCVQCFRGKDENELRLPCQNPRCHFYLRIQSPVYSSISEPNAGSEHARELGYTLSRRSSLNSDYLFGSSGSIQSESGGIWGHQPLGAHLQMPSARSVRSHSTSVELGGVAHARKIMRSRLMSMPICVEQFGDHNELVDDTFPSSPLPYYHRKIEEDRVRIIHSCAIHTLTYLLLIMQRDADSGIGSPFGRPSPMLEWGAGEATKCKTASGKLSPFNMEVLTKEISGETDTLWVTRV